MNILSSVRFAFRILRKHPMVTGVAVLTLGLAVGANTALFSLVRPLLLDPLPFPQSEELAIVWSTQPSKGLDEMFTAVPDFREWQEQSRSFEDLAAWTAASFTLVGNGAPEQLTGLVVSSNFFDLLGAAPALGPGFQAEDEQYGNHYKVILSHGFWQRRYGGDPDIVGKTLSLDGNPYQVAGVMPAEFNFPQPGIQIWTPLALPSDSNLATRSNRFLLVTGRLAEGHTLESARKEMNVLAASLAEQYPENAGVGTKVLPLRDLIVGDIERPLWMLAGAVAFVLLIACVNIANVLLARAQGRRTEIAVRGAMGADRGQVLGQLLVESVVLGLMGGLVGVVFAFGAVHWLTVMEPPNIPRLDAVGVDFGVLLFALVLSVLVSLAFGLLPALQNSKPDFAQDLREGGRTGVSKKGRRIRGALVVGEVALTLILLVGSGLLIRSLNQILAVDPGFRTDNVLTMQVSLPPARYQETHQATSFFQRAIDRIDALPGVESVAAGSRIPFIQSDWTKNFSIEGRPMATSVDEVPPVQFRQVTPGYFETLGTPLKRGRSFNEGDHEEARPIAIINAALAERYFPDEDPLDKRVWLGPPEHLIADLLPPGFQFPRLTIVGVVDDVRQYALNEPARPEIYVPHRQGGSETARFMYLIVHTNSDPTSLTPAIRRQVSEIDPQQPVSEVSTLEDRMASSLSQVRFQTFLLTLFALLAVTLAAVGIYGVISYDVAQRKHEIGIRTAMGAEPSNILTLIIGQGMRLTLLGAVIGVAGALLLVRALQGLVFGISVHDPLTLVVAVLFLVLIAFVASYIPGRRASHVDPNLVLRQAQGQK